jgi:hypothetical protein
MIQILAISDPCIHADWLMRAALGAHYVLQPSQVLSRALKVMVFFGHTVGNVQMLAEAWHAERRCDMGFVPISVGKHRFKLLQ